ncbi:FtsW/RodA/SpoVE family cell cycle protein, partial [Candidatus Neomarinimicrobiota bacterium]
LLITYFMPAMSGGRRWIVLGGFSFQPSELGKIIIVLALAKFLAENKKNLTKFHFALLPLAIAAFPALIVMGQPDLGTAIIFLAVAFAMMFWAGVSMIHLFIMVAPLISLISGFNFYAFSSWMLILVLVLYFSKSNLKWAAVNFFMNASFGTLAPTLWNMLQPYQKRRVLTLLDASADPQGAGYQVLQSMTAIGSGGIFGKGLGEGTQTHLRFLPVTDTDFIIAVIGEELGLIAILAILILYSWMLLRMVDRASTTQYQTASLSIIGFSTVFLVHVFVNMGMAIGIMPVTGLPLPFMSYGGSFLLTCTLMIGITHFVLAQEP